MSDRLEPESMLTMPGIGVQLGRNAHHGQRLVDPKQRVLPTHPLNISPSQLLQARPDAFLATSRAA